MQLPLIDFFADGVQTIPTEYESSISPMTGCSECVQISSANVKDYIGLAELAITHEEAVDGFVNDSLTPQVIEPWRGPMGSRIPSAISRYQKKNQWSSDVDLEIHSIDAILTEGQKLYRGGLTMPGVQKTGLSTTFSPAVAIREAFWKGKAQALGKLYLYVLSVSSPRTNVYVFKQHGSSLGHEKEVLFASGAIIGTPNIVRTGKMPTGLPYGIFEARIS